VKTVLQSLSLLAAFFTLIAGTFALHHARLQVYQHDTAFEEFGGVG